MKKTRRLKDLGELKVGMTIRGIKSRLDYQITKVTADQIIATRLQEVSNTQCWLIVED